MKAIHGGKAKHDTIDSQKIAVLLRGGMLPQVYVYPAEMRATRDLLRRRLHLAHTRGELLAHVQHTNSQDHLPAIGKHIADKANRDGVAERVADPAVHKSLEVDLALVSDDDALLRDVERTIVKTAKPHDANTLSLRPTVPGLGKMLSLVRLDDIHAMARFPRVQDVVSSGRLVTCAKASAGKRFGPSGKKIGHAHLQWAFPRPPCCSCATIQPGKHTWPAWRQHTTRGKPCLSWLTSWRGRSMTDSSAKRPLRGTRASMARGAARVRLTPHGTPMG